MRNATNSRRRKWTPAVHSALIALAVVPACSQDRYVGPRYRAERELWRINQEYKRLSIKPELVEPETWRQLAARYERIAEDNKNVQAATAAEPADNERSALRGIVARAYVSAAQVHASVGDSLKMTENYGKVTSGFQDIPMVVAEVALAQGQLAENRHEWEAAAAAYDGVLERVPPQPGEPGVGGVILNLPIRIARLRAQAAVAATGATGDSGTAVVPAAASASYDEARRRYEGWIQAHPGTRIEIESRLHLGDLAADQGRWQEALVEIQKVEAQTTGMKESPVEPGGLRLSAAMVMSRAAAAPDSIRNTLRSILKDYSQSPAAPQALLLLARQAAAQGAVPDALEYLDQLRADYAAYEQFASEGMLLRARILESDGRWPEALEVLRNLPVQFPLTEAAIQAPLEIVAHYARVEDQEEVKSALQSAEREYRTLIERYPSGPPTLLARTKLVQTILLQERFDEAIAELLGISDAMQGNPRAAGFMVEAARVAQQKLGNSARAAEILDQIAVRYPNMEIGRWASNEASRLREAHSE